MRPFVNIHSLLLAAFFFSFLALRAAATTYYVEINSPNPAPPYTNWNTAATDIQSAVNQTTNGDLVLVNPGVYQSGGYTAPNGGLYSVVVTNTITLQSVYGSAATAVDGGGTVACIYLTSGANLSGFSITNGSGIDTGFAGGIVCPYNANSYISNCLIINNIGESGAGASSGIFYNCTFTGNTNQTFFGGAANGSTLNNCFLYNNTAVYGGAAAESALNNCIVSNNFASQSGGGVWAGSAVNSLIISNSTEPGPGINGIVKGFGGGASVIYLSNCVVQGNCAGTGGGVSQTDNRGDYTHLPIIRCTIIGNSATDGGGFGIVTGPNQFITFISDCLICSNQANVGGGAYFNRGGYQGLYNCTVADNTATNSGGGIVNFFAYNSIVYDNNAPQFPNVDGFSAVNCCFGQDATTGSGFFTNAPSFVNPVAGDFHLQSNSPCINAGNNGYVTNSFYNTIGSGFAIVTNDIDGNPRIIGGTVDIGCYEYQSPVSELPYLWLEQYGLSITNNVDTSSPNGTAFDVYQDWIAGLNPTNPASVLAMLPPPATNNASGITVSWQSVSGINYNLLRATNLLASFVTIAANISGQAGTTSYKDTTATNNVPYFYSVGVP